MIAIACSSGAPAAAQTSYTGGNGGAWSNPGNWTDGVPGSGTTATVDDGTTVDTDGNDVTGSLQIGPIAGSGVSVSAGTTLSVASGISNSGQVGLNGALELIGNVTLSGGGTFTMTGTTSPGNTGQIGTNGTGYTLTNQSTIQGSGLIGSNAVTYQNLSLNNSGVINGNSTANALEIAGTGASIVNTGTLKATAGGGLILATTAPIANVGGTILADGAGSAVTVSTTIQGGTLTTTNSGVIQTGAGGAYLDASPTGGITLTDGSTYTATAGTTSIRGTLNLGTSTGSTLALGGALELTGDTTLSGPGTLTMTGVTNPGSTGQIGTNGTGYTLINKSTIQGSGLIGSNAVTYQNLSLNNSGVINGDSTVNALEIAGTGSSIVNTGTLKATAGGGLILATTAPIVNVGGTILADGAGSAVTVSTTVQGGTLTTTRSGVMQTGAGGAFLDASPTGGITLTDGSAYTATAGLTSVRGALNLGTTAGSTLTLGNQLQLVGDTTLSGPGAVNISGNPGGPTGGQIGTNGNGFTLTNNLTIQGSGLIGSNAGALYQNLSLANNGTINANTNGAALTIGGTGASIVNAGQLNASNGGTLSLSTNAAVNNQAGTISAAGAGSAVNITDTTIQGGTLRTSGGAVMQTVGTSQLDAASHGAITFADGSTYTSGISALTQVTGALKLGTAAGASLALGGQMQLVGDTTLSGPGVVNISGNPGGPTGGQIGTNGNGFTLTNNLTIQGSGLIGSNVGALYQNLSLANNGTINANANGEALTVGGTGASIVNASLLEATNGGTLNLSTNAAVNNQAGTISAAAAGSAVNITNTTIQGGTLSTSGGAVMQTVGTSQLDGASHGAITLSDGSAYASGPAAFTELTGTLNLGTSKGSTLAVSGQAQLVGNVTVAGPGSLTLSGAGQIGTNGNGFTLTNQSTIQGSGLLGSNAGALYSNGSVNNQGLILANGGTLTVAETGGVANSGTLEAGAGSVLTQTGGPLANYSGGTLTGGTYRADAGGVLNLNTGAITTDAATIVLNGTGSAVATTAGAIETQLTSVASGGQLQILAGRSYATTNAISNSGLVLLGGGALTPQSLTNSSTGTLKGFGSYAPTSGAALSNAGLVQANGGTLALANGVTGAGAAQIDAGASLDLSGATSASSVATLLHNGTNLNLGSQNILVSTDYNNASFGVGNSFNNHANVTGTGQILATGDVKLAISGSGISGSPSSPTLALGTFHTGGGGGTSFTIGNGGTTGPSLRGAVQTTGISNPAIGLTASNFGPLAPGATTNEALTFSPGSAGAIVGQSFKVVSNFDNVAPITVGLTGTAYDLANPTVGNTLPINLGNFHVGAAPAQQAVSITNTVVSNAAYQEGLDVSAGTPTGAAVGNGGSISLLAAGKTNSSAITVGLNGTTAGVESGGVALALTSNGSGTSGLGLTSLASKTVSVTGTAYNLASSNTIAPVSFGVLHVGDGGGTEVKTLSVTNTAPAGKYSEGLDSTFGSYSNSGGTLTPTASGSITNLAAGSTDNSSLKLSLSTTTAGMVSGTIAVHQASNGTIDGLANTALADQNPGVSGSVTATVTNLAQPVINTAQPVSFGNVRIGSAVPTQGLSITNGAPSGGFSEGLIANVTGTTGTGVTASGGFGAPGSSLAPQATNATGVQVGIDTSAAGAKSGAAVIDFKSDGTGFSGGTVTDLGPTNVAVSGAVYRLANPTAIAPVTLAARVGDAAPSTSLSVTNASPDIYTEGLKASLGSATGPFTASGSVANLSAGQTDGSSLKVGLSTATAGVFTGSATATLASTGAGTDGAADLALTPQTVGLTGKVYATAAASVTSAPIQFGIVHVGDTVAAQNVTIANMATGALTDTLRGGFGAISGPFTGTGALADVTAGSSGKLSVGLNTATAGVYSGTAGLALTSHDADLADVAVAAGPVSLSGTVNNYAKAALVQTAGAGMLSGAATTYTLNFGMLTQGSGAQTADLALANAVTGPADVLGGGFTANAPDFSFSGLSAFSGLMAGGQHAVDVTLSTASAGMFDETLTFDGDGSNASGYTGPNQEIVLTLEGDVVASGSGGGGSPVPEPGTLALLTTAALGLVGIRRSRAA